MNLDGKTILVTGAYGHIGSYIVEEICKKFIRCKILCLDNNYNGNIDNLKKAHELSESRYNKIVYLDQCSITEWDKLQSLFVLYKPDIVFHEASMLTLDSKKNRLRSTHVGVIGSTNIFELSLTHKVEKVVYASSASVYGSPKYTPTDEECPKECSLLYGAHKIAVEAIADSYIKEEGLDVVGLRYFNVYGPRQSSSNVYTQIVAKWLKEIRDNKKVEIYGDGTQTMDMIYGGDIGRLNIKSLDAPAGFYNIGTGIQTSVKELLSIMIKEICPHQFDDIDIVYLDHDPALVKERQADVTKMNKYIGQHDTSVKEGIRKIVDNDIF